LQSKRAAITFVQLSGAERQSAAGRSDLAAASSASVCSSAAGKSPHRDGCRVIPRRCQAGGGKKLLDNPDAAAQSIGTIANLQAAPEGGGGCFFDGGRHWR